jgi:hypothetical protein
MKRGLSGITYRDVLRAYRRDLYKSKLYWSSAIFIALSAILILVNLKEYLLTSLILGVIGIIVLTISKFRILKLNVGL